MFRHVSARTQLASLTVLGGLLATVLSAGPASAATISPADCAAATGKISVRAVAISQGDTITLQATPPDGTYQGTATAEVFCRATNGANLGDISDSTVQITINPAQPGVTAAMFTVSGQGVPTADVNALTPGNPVRIGPFTGAVTFNVIGATNLLPPGVAAADVAVDIEVVSDAWGAPLIDPITGSTLHPGTFGDVLAQTPELDSLALFASGALGLVGYAGLRRRARGSR